MAFTTTWPQGEGKTYSCINMIDAKGDDPVHVKNGKEHIFNPEDVEYKTGFTAEAFDLAYILRRRNQAPPPPPMMPYRTARVITQAERCVGPANFTQKYDDVPPRLHTMPALYYSHENIMRGVLPFPDGSIAVQRGGRHAVYRSLGDYRQGCAAWRSHPRRGCQLWRDPTVRIRYGIFPIRGRPVNPLSTRAYNADLDGEW